MKLIQERPKDNLKRQKKEKKKNVKLRLKVQKRSENSLICKHVTRILA